MKLGGRYIDREEILWFLTPFPLKALFAWLFVWALRKVYGIK